MASLSELTFLDFTSTQISDLSPVASLAKLKKIRADKTNLSPEGAILFVQNHPNILLIHHVEDLKSWWENLSFSWKNALKKNNPALEGDKPEIEILTETLNLANLNLDSTGIENLDPIVRFISLATLNFSNNPLVDNLLPLQEVKTLKKLTAKNTGIEELISLSKLTKLKKLNLSGTNIKSLKGVEPLVNLEELDVASTDLRSLKALEGITALKKLSCFNTRLTPRAVDSFKESFPKCEVRFY